MNHRYGYAARKALDHADLEPWERKRARKAVKKDRQRVRKQDRIAQGQEAELWNL